MILCPRLPDRPARRPTLGGHVPRAHRPHRPRRGLRGDDVHVPGLRREHRRLLAAGVDRRPAGRHRPSRGDRRGERGGPGRHQHRRLDRHLRRRRRPPGEPPQGCSARVPTSTTGRCTRAGSSTTPARSARSAPRLPGRSFDEWNRAFRSFRPSTRPAGSRRGRCWSCTAKTTRACRRVTPASSPKLTGTAELCLLPGAGHRLRHDPRAIAILLGWLDRVRTEKVA
jgi:hypothetical protein